MASLLLELYHHLRQMVRGYDLPHAEVADLPVLAKNAPKVAAGKEDGPRTMIPDQDVFLAKMRGVTGDLQLFAGTAYTASTAMPVDPA